MTTKEYPPEPGYGMMGLGESLVYNPYVFNDPTLLASWKTASPKVRIIIRHFLNSKKVIGSFEVARYIIGGDDRFYTRDGQSIRFSDEDIIEAYAIACGDGCEFEWPHE